MILFFRICHKRYVEYCEQILRLVNVDSLFGEWCISFVALVTWRFQGEGNRARNGCIKTEACSHGNLKETKYFSFQFSDDKNLSFYSFSESAIVSNRTIVRNSMLFDIQSVFGERIRGNMRMLSFILCVESDGTKRNFIRSF